MLRLHVPLLFLFYIETAHLAMRRMGSDVYRLAQPESAGDGHC